MNQQEKLYNCTMWWDDMRLFIRRHDVSADDLGLSDKTYKAIMEEETRGLPLKLIRELSAWVDGYKVAMNRMAEK